MKTAGRKSFRSPQGWLLLELLMASTIMLMVVGLGAMALFGLLDFKQNMWMESLPLQTDFTRLILHLEQDEANADRVIDVDGSMLRKTGEEYLTSNVHGLSGQFTYENDYWDMVVRGPSFVTPDYSTLIKETWLAGDSSIEEVTSDLAASSGEAATKTDEVYYSTVAFLKGFNQIVSVLYISYQEVDGNLKYSIVRLANNGNRLIKEDEISFTVEGFQVPFDVASNDQQNSDDVLLRKVGVYDDSGGEDPLNMRTVVRFPSAFNRGIRDMKTGDTSKLVKQLNDWLFAFRPKSANRWIAVP